MPILKNGSTLSEQAKDRSPCEDLQEMLKLPPTRTVTQCQAELDLFQTAAYGVPFFRRVCTQQTVKDEKKLEKAKEACSEDIQKEYRRIIKG